MNSRLLLLLTVFLAGCSQPVAPTVQGVPPSEPGAAPQWTAGDNWETATTGRDLSMTQRIEVGAAGPAEVRLETDSRTKTGRLDVDARSMTWIDAPGIATKRVQTTTSTTLDGQTYKSTSDATFSPPCPILRHPLRVGMDWQQTCNAEVSLQGGTQQATTTVHYNVEAQETVRVPAGTFDAMRVRVVEGKTTALQWYSAQACNLVKTIMGEGDEAMTMELQKYHCAAASP